MHHLKNKNPATAVMAVISRTQTQIVKKYGMEQIFLTINLFALKLKILQNCDNVEAKHLNLLSGSCFQTLPEFKYRGRQVED